MIRVLIVEDHDILAESLKGMLTSEYEVVGVVKDAKLTLLYCQKFNPDLILMDVLTANNSSGIDACKDVKGKFPNTKVLIITGFDGMGYIKRGEEAKADGYITKDRPKDEILAAIKNVMEGKKVFPNETLDEETDSNNLTSKEQEVLFYVCEGLTRSEIAEKMFISEATVKTHLGNLFSKTNTRNRTELAIYAVTNGYVENIKK